uniref:Alba domain-containing protein n=1 Tax=Macrostomum lignano TaxID=282301 RepID=A0A1I8IZZ4_9PLAT
MEDIQQQQQQQKRKTVEVLGVGEVPVVPDQCSVVFVIRSTKETVEEANASAIKRYNYLLQLLGNSHIKENCVKSNREVTRHNQQSLTLSITVSVLFSDFNVFEKVCNQVAEKLDSAVSISKPTFIATASLLAVANAKSKAGDIARYFNCTLLKPFRIIDEGCNEGAEAASLPAAAGSAQPTWAEELNKSTVTWRSRVRVQFELRRFCKASSTVKL